MIRLTRAPNIAIAALWLNLCPFFAILWAMVYGFMPNAYQIAGGLVALAAEEALADLTRSAPIESISLRYLRGFRGSGAHATARIDGTLGRCEVVDDDGRLGTLVIVRFAPT
jgi:hypothetical protein